MLPNIKTYVVSGKKEKGETGDRVIFLSQYMNTSPVTLRFTSFLQYVCSFSDLSGIMAHSNMTLLQFYALPESVLLAVRFHVDGAWHRLESGKEWPDRLELS
jgi:hypothetical protein